MLEGRQSQIVKNGGFYRQWSEIGPGLKCYPVRRVLLYQLIMRVYPQSQYLLEIKRTSKPMNMIDNVDVASGWVALWAGQLGCKRFITSRGCIISSYYLAPRTTRFNSTTWATNNNYHFKCWLCLSVCLAPNHPNSRNDFWGYLWYNYRYHGQNATSMYLPQIYVTYATRLQLNSVHLDQ